MIENNDNLNSPILLKENINNENIIDIQSHNCSSYVYIKNDNQLYIIVNGMYSTKCYLILFLLIIIPLIFLLFYSILCFDEEAKVLGIVFSSFFLFFLITICFILPCSVEKKLIFTFDLKNKTLHKKKIKIFYSKETYVYNLINCSYFRFGKSIFSKNYYMFDQKNKSFHLFNVNLSSYDRETVNCFFNQNLEKMKYKNEN